MWRLQEETLVETIDALGCFHDSFRQQCDRMQFISSFLKLGRSRSHPERQIGASDHHHITDISTTKTDTSLSEVLLMRICSHLFVMGSFATSEKSENYFRFFFLSLLLDVLKAFKALDEALDENSKSLKRKSQLLGYSCNLNYQATVSVIVRIVAGEENDSPWFQSRSCCLKVFDIIRFLISDDSLSRFDDDKDILLLLYRCCGAALISRDKINLSIEINAQSTVTRTSSSVSTFFCDDINSGLSVELLALHISLFNQSLKYESLTSSSERCSLSNINNNNLHNLNERNIFSNNDSSHCDGSDKGHIVGDIFNSSADLPNFLNEIRKAAMELGKSMVSRLSLIGVISMLSQLAQNDKELISTLLDTSEIELRLQHNIDLFLKGKGTTKLLSTDVASYSDEVTTARESKRDCERSSKDKDNEEVFYACCSKIFNQLQEVAFGSISSFLLFISGCIAFDATLFCDYLCSPETSALKYLLRITKQLMVLVLDGSSCPSSPKHVKYKYKWDKRSKRLFHICDMTVFNSKSVQSHGASSSSGNCGSNSGVSGEDGPKHRVLSPSNFTATDNVSKDHSIHVDLYPPPISIAAAAPPVSSSGSVHVLSWIASETSTTLHDCYHVSRGQNSSEFTDESLWGFNGRHQVSGLGPGLELGLGQRICPSEWLRETDDAVLLNGSIDIPSSRIPGKELEKRDYVRSDCDEHKKAVALYRGAADFLVDVRTFLSKSASSNKFSVSVPFDCSLLVSRLDIIISML